MSAYFNKIPVYGKYHQYRFYCKECGALCSQTDMPLPYDNGMKHRQVLKSVNVYCPKCKTRAVEYI